MRSKGILFFLVAALLCSCSPVPTVDWEGGYREEDLVLPEAPSPSFTIAELNAQDEGEEAPGLPSLGKVRPLVIPIEFAEFPFPEAASSKIENAFSGKESVSSFYEESSGGLLRLDFLFGEKVVLEGSALSHLQGNGSMGRKTISILRKGVSAQDPSLLKEADSNGDGFLDAVYLIYSAPTFEEHDYGEASDSRASEFWAYTYYDYGREGDPEDPCGMGYVWCSYSFLDRAKEGDPRTLIHETGHLFGLPDLYSEAGEDDSYLLEEEKYRMPMGGLDMMDLGLGDHNGWSKYALGWKRALYVPEDAPDEFVIELTGERDSLFLLPPGEEPSPYSEGLWIELYDPRGLNEKDANERYLGIYPFNYSIPGIRMIHVDARLCQGRRNGSLVLKEEYSKEKEPSLGEGTFYLLSSDNDPRLSKTDRNSLLALVEADGVDRLSNQDYPKTGLLHYADNRDLFVPEEGRDFFRMDTHSSFFQEKDGLPCLNSGESFPYEIRVNGIRDGKDGLSASLTISRV